MSASRWPGEMRLQWWPDVLAGEGHGDIEANPVAAELLRAIARYAPAGRAAARLIDEHQFDLYNDPMPSMAALEGYGNDTRRRCSALAAHVLARPSEAIDHLARHAGLALGSDRR